MAMRDDHSRGELAQAKAAELRRPAQRIGGDIARHLQEQDGGDLYFDVTSCPLPQRIGHVLRDAPLPRSSNSAIACSMRTPDPNPLSSAPCVNLRWLTFPTCSRWAIGKIA
jgi:hypothetical protein